MATADDIDQDDDGGVWAGDPLAECVGWAGVVVLAAGGLAWWAGCVGRAVTW